MVPNPYESPREAAFKPQVLRRGCYAAFSWWEIAIIALFVIVLVRMGISAP